MNETDKAKAKKRPAATLAALLLRGAVVTDAAGNILYDGPELARREAEKKTSAKAGEA